MTPKAVLSLPKCVFAVWPVLPALVKVEAKRVTQHRRPKNVRPLVSERVVVFVMQKCNKNTTTLKVKTN
jgi:hypothetical protein